MATVLENLTTRRDQAAAELASMLSTDDPAKRKALRDEIRDLTQQINSHAGGMEVIHEAIT